MQHEHKYYSDKNINARIKRGRAIIENDTLKFRCSYCDEFYPATTEFFHLDSGRLKCKCKGCWVGRYADNKAKNAILKQKNIYNSFLIRANSCV